MITLTGNFRVDAVNALCDIIVALGLVPSCGIAGGASQGATAFDVTDPAFARLCQEDGIVTFYDGTDEFPCRIDSVAGSTITVDFSGRAITGFEFAHDDNAVVATNIIPIYRRLRAQSLTSVMLDSGRPVWRVWMEDSASLPKTFAGGYSQHQPHGALCVYYQLRGTQTGTPQQQMPMDLLALDRTKTSERDLFTLQRAVQLNPTLNRAIFDIDSFAQAARTDESGSDPIWEQYLDIYCRGDIR